LKKKGDIVVMVDDDWFDLWSVRNENPLIDAETMKFDKFSGKITEIGKKPTRLDEIERQYTGLIKISKNKITDFLQFYDRLDRTKLYDGNTFANMYMTSLLQLLIDSNWDVVPAHVSHGWLEVDTVSDLLNYERLKKSGGLDALWRHDK
jgi:choline kinase